MTTRDTVWSSTLRMLTDHSATTVQGVLNNDDRLDESNRRTVQRVLREMEREGWVRRDSDRSGIWRRGERFAAIMEKDAETQTINPLGVDG